MFNNFSHWNRLDNYYFKNHIFGNRVVKTLLKHQVILSKSAFSKYIINKKSLLTVIKNGKLGPKIILISLQLG